MGDPRPSRDRVSGAEFRVRAVREQTRRRLYSTYGYRLDGGTTLRLDVQYVRNEENLPGSLTRQEFERDPRQRNPDAAFAQEARNYDYTRVAFTVRTPLSTTQALVILARKLLRVAFAVCKTGQPFDVARLLPRPTLA